MIGTIIKFPGSELPDGYERANDALYRKDRYPALSRALAATLETQGDHFFMPSGDDRLLLDREVPTEKTWVNGERIYRYGFEYSSVRTTAGSDTISLDPIGTINSFTNLFGFISSASTNLWIPLPNNQGSGSTHDIRLLIDLSGNDIVISYASAVGSGYSGYVFVEYIKNTTKDRGLHIIRVIP